MSSRFEKRERKCDSCRGVQDGSCNVIDRSVCEKCPKWCSMSGMKRWISTC